MRTELEVFQLSLPVEFSIAYLHAILIIRFVFQQRLSIAESISREEEEKNYSSDEEPASVKAAGKNTSMDEDVGASSNIYAYKGSSSYF